MEEKKIDVSITFSGQQRILPNTDDIVPNMPWVDSPKKKPWPIEKPSWFSRVKTWILGK